MRRGLIAGLLGVALSWSSVWAASSEVFDGSLSKAENTATPSALNSLTTLTAAAWIYATGAGEGPGFPAIINKPYSADDTKAYWRLKFEDEATSSCTPAARNNTIAFLVSWQTTLGNWVGPNNAAAKNAWYFYTVTYDMSLTSNAPILYINAVSQTICQTSTPAGTAPPDSTRIEIGNNNAQTRTFAGNIAFAHVYNRILSVVEVTEIMRHPYSIANGLVGAWPLLGDSPETDLSGQGTTLTLTSLSTSSALGPPVFLVGSLARQSPRLRALLAAIARR